MRFLGIDSERDRWRLQALRADPPGLAKASGARRRVFGAALEQWDALMVASAGLSAAASPILLFYALAQAGRALSAARVAGQPWRSQAHGLSVNQAGAPLGNTVISPTEREASGFALFCRSLDSPRLSADTTLGALWASNPHLEVVEGLGSDSDPVLPLSAITSGEPAVRALLVGDAASALPDNPSEAAVVLRRRLAAYPTTRDGLAVGSQVPRSSHDGRPQIEIAWHDDAGRPRLIERFAPSLGGPNSGTYLFPALNDADDVLHPLALWWATLLTLSSLARYHPEEWRAALVRDRSAVAVPLEEGLDVARELLPWLILHALTTSP